MATGILLCQPLCFSRFFFLSFRLDFLFLCNTCLFVYLLVFLLFFFLFASCCFCFASCHLTIWTQARQWPRNRYTHKHTRAKQAIEPVLACTDFFFLPFRSLSEHINNCFERIKWWATFITYSQWSFRWFRWNLWFGMIIKWLLVCCLYGVFFFILFAMFFCFVDDVTSLMCKKKYIN